MDRALHWQKSTFSDGGEGNTCLELAFSSTDIHIHLRESDTPASVLTTTPAALARLLEGIRDGAP
ncbi:DUF397 domain-containing protein [Streptomyces phaeoluteigriseus]